MIRLNSKKYIIVSAYATSPYRGSECAVGWEIITRLKKYFDITVLVCLETPSHKPYFKEIQEELKKTNVEEGLVIVPVEMPENSKKYTKLHDLGFWPAYYWGYKSWQKAAYKKAKELHETRPFDASYQLNMIGFREPGYLWELGIPFFWGPINGFHSIPLSFIKCFSGKEYLSQILKHIANKTQIKFSYRARKAARKASLVWCVDDISFYKLKEWKANVELMQEAGLQNYMLKSQKNRYYDGKRRLNIVCSGMITSGKAYFILIDALLRLKNENFHLTFLGDGPLKSKLMKKGFDIKDKISWHGWVEHSIALKLISQSDILIHPSLKEATSMTILEALGYGVPVICHDTCGMGIVVNDTNGFKIPYNNAPNSIDYLEELLSSIFTNPNVLNSRFDQITKCIEELKWDSKVRRIANRFTETLDKESNLKFS